MLKKIAEFNCVVTLENGKLMKAKLLPGEGIEITYGQINWEEVRGPVSNAFLVAINRELGTQFKVEDFENSQV